MKKFVVYFMVAVLMLPSFILYKPTKAEAILPLIARGVAMAAARAGLIKKIGNVLKVPLKPYKGKLYQGSFKKWVAPATGSIAAHALAIFGLVGFNDTQKPSCTNWSYTKANLGSFSGATPLAVLDNIHASSLAADGGTQYTNVGILYPHSLIELSSLRNGFPEKNIEFQYRSSGTPLNPNLKLVTAFERMFCANTSVQDVSALDDYIEVEFLPNENDPVALDNKSKNLHAAIHNYAGNNPNADLTSEVNEGFTVEVVDTLDYTEVLPDGTTVNHVYSTDPTTGEILLDGQPVGDNAILVDGSNTEHDFSVDTVTGNITDNGVDKGNFVEYVDADGVTHTMTSDPTTGVLLDNGEPFNPQPTPVDVTQGTDTSITVDSYGNVISSTTTNVDLSPVVNAIGREITEQKKTTDAVKALNDDFNQARNDDIASIDDALAPIRTKEATNNFMGVNGFIGRVQGSPIYQSLSTGLQVQTVTGYPKWEATPHVNILGHDFSFTLGLDTADFAWVFSAMKGMFLVTCAWFSWRRIFG